MLQSAIVVPCFNEASRLDRARFVELARDPSVRLVFVDDGSRDDTRAVLLAMKSCAGTRIDVLEFDANRGKGEAVRRGLLHAFDGGAQLVGFLDADLSTPPAEMLRLVRRIEERGEEVQVVLGARVGLAGTSIDRRMSRHYLGRLFATAASIILRERFYDTQCGAKLFRVTGALRAAVASPFLSRWAFDVELIGRLLVGSHGVPPLDVTAFYEEPLQEWTHVTGSKLKPAAFARVAADLVRINIELSAARARRPRSRPSRAP